MVEPDSVYKIELPDDEWDKTRYIKGQSDYFTAPKLAVQNHEMTWEAKGVLLFFLSVDDRVFDRITTEFLWRKFPGGRERIRRILRELESFGYLERRQQKKADGTYEWLTTVKFNPDHEFDHAPETGQWTMEVYRSYNNNKDKISIEEGNNTKILFNEVKDIKIKEEKKDEFFEEQYLALLKLWAELFPEKPQPKFDTASYRKQFKTRLANASFKVFWRAALERAAEHKAMHVKSWFNLRFLLANNANYAKLLEGQYDFLDDKLSERELLTYDKMLNTKEIDQVEWMKQFTS